MGSLKNILKTTLPLGIGVFFIFLTLKNTTAEEQNIILGYMKKADLKFVVLSGLFGILSHLSRAYRWNFLLHPLGYHARFINSILAVLIAYISNLGIPRSGEFLRATTISTYEKIPFEKGFGTIIAERMVDLVMLIIFILLALGLQFDLIWNVLEQNNFSFSKLILIGTVLLIVFFLLRGPYKRGTHPLLIKIKQFIAGLMEGIYSLKNIKNKGAFLFHTLFIWFMYFAMFYVIKWTVPETESLTAMAMLPAFVIGGLTISATNGGVGIYPFSVALVLSAYGISNESGLAFGWIMWSAQTAIVILFGSLSFFILPLINQRLKPEPNG